MLLGGGGDDINVLGKAFVRYQRENLRLNLYRQEIDMPYLNKQDSRMIPNTFEGYTLSREGTTVEYFVAHVAKIKRRNDGTFARSTTQVKPLMMLPISGRKPAR